MEDEIFEQRTDLSKLKLAVEHIKATLAKIIVGQHDSIDLLIAGILAGGHILIEGVPGVAKTLTAKLIAKSIDAKYSRIQFTPDLMPSDILGTSVFNPKTTDFEFNNMQEPFTVLATQNPVEHEGTYRLPEAQLDRFLFKIEIKYPSLDEEIAIITQQHSKKTIDQLKHIEPVLTAQDVIWLRDLVMGLHVEYKLVAYVAKIIHESRNNKSLYLGGSPRASLAIINAAKALAAIRGRDFVTPDDIIYVSAPVLRHRIMLTPDKEMEGVTPDDVVAQIIQKIEVPR
jgi:MoxR-like ATPase